jgi:uncharacterized RDD family membrane protein YckC
MTQRARLAAWGLGLLICAMGAATRSQAASPHVAGYSAADLYNVANADARAGKPGMAVLNYERARLLAPNDPDIAANLRATRAAAHLPAAAPLWIERAHLMANPTLIAWLGLLGLLLTGAGAVSGGRYPQFRWTRRLGVTVGIALLGLTLCNALVLWPLLHEAVVLTAATPVRVTPVPMGDPLFVLAEAETVRIATAHEDFVLIRTAAGRTGWVARANLAAVVPDP